MRRKKIFLLEDDDGIRELIQLILEDHGYEVTSFPSVESFMHGFQVGQPQLIVMDVWLPDGDGRSVCNHLRREESTRKIPILMMTAQYGIRKIEGASDFISKPFDISEFIERVERLLSASC